MLLVSSGKSAFAPLAGSRGDHVRLTFDGDSARATLENQSNGTQQALTLPYADFPRFTQLSAETPKRDELSVHLVTRPTSVRFDALRWVLFAAALVFSTIAVSISRPRVRRPVPTSTVFAYWPQHLTVALGITAGATFVPMFYDDGWVIQRVTQFLSTGYLGDFYFHANAWLPQGYLTESLLSVLVSWGLPFIVLRLFVAALLLIAWLMLARAALLIRRRISRSAVWLAAFTFIAIGAVWCVSLRAEAWVCFFLAAQILFFVRYLQNRSPVSFFISGAFAGAAIATHQTGFVSLVPLAFMGYFAVRGLRAPHRFGLIISVAGIGAVTLAMFFAGYDLHTILANVKDFSDGAYQNRLDEIYRLGQVSGPAISSARKAGWIITIFVAVMAIASLHRARGMQRALSVIALLMPFGLLLTSSKWGWHYGVLLVPATLLVLLLVDESPGVFRLGRPRFAIWLPLLTIGAAVSLASAGSWGDYDFSQFDWSSFSNTIAGPSTQVFWFAAILTGAGLGFAIDRRALGVLGGERIGVLLTCVLLVVPAAASAAWIIKDTMTTSTEGYSNWTLLRQNLKTLALQGSGSCGILGNQPVFAGEIDPLEISGAAVETTMLIPIEADGFAWPGTQAWSTVGQNGENAGTPFYTLKGGQEQNGQFAFWWQTHHRERDGQVAMSIVSRFADGSESSQSVIEVVPNYSSWNKVEFGVPSDAVAVRIVLNGTPGGDIEITQPVITYMRSASDVLSNGTSFIAPNLLPGVPCAKLPAANAGLFPLFNYLIARTYPEDSQLWIEQYFPPDSVMLTQLGAARPGVPNIWQAEFDLASALVAREITTPN